MSNTFPTFRLSPILRPRLDAAAAIAATSCGFVPLDSECAIGRPSLDASNRPLTSGRVWRSASMCSLNISCFAILFVASIRLGAVQRPLQIVNCSGTTVHADCPLTTVERRTAWVEAGSPEQSGLKQFFRCIVGHSYLPEGSSPCIIGKLTTNSRIEWQTGLLCNTCQ
jgi:hypothetical protein